VKGNPKIDNDRGDLGLPDPNGQMMVLFVVEAPKGVWGQGPGDWGKRWAVPHQTEQVPHLTALGKES
jgi:hypothetical protein